MYEKNDYIAVFDSGVGGISVLRHLVKEMPRERFLYFGDSANAPYGTRSTEEIRALTFAAAERLLSRDVKALVLACNTKEIFDSYFDVDEVGEVVIYENTIS